MTFPTRTLSFLASTDCVKDRLTWYYSDGDRQGLAQAQLVAHTTDIDPGETERWSAKQGKSEEFAQIRNVLRKFS